MRALTLTVGSLALALAVAGCPGDGEPTAAAPPATPQEAFERASAAWQAEDYAGVLAVTPPADREINVLGMVVGAGFMLMMSEDAEAAEAELEAMMKKHGVALEEDLQLGDEEEMRAKAAELLAGVDLGALFGDLMGFLQKHAPDGGSPDEMFAAELTDLEIDGETATAKAGDDELRFIQVDGAWYLQMG